MNDVKVTIQIDDEVINSQLQELIKDADVMTEIHEMYAEVIDPWVPMDTGLLANDLVIDETGILYEAYDELDGYYAAKNYYGVGIKHKKAHHPLATAFWDKVAMQTEYERVKQLATEIIIRKANNG